MRFILSVALSVALVAAVAYADFGNPGASGGGGGVWSGSATTTLDMAGNAIFDSSGTLTCNDNVSVTGTLNVTSTSTFQADVNMSSMDINNGSLTANNAADCAPPGVGFDSSGVAACAPTTDVSGTDLNIRSRGAYPDAATNLTGQNINLIPGQGVSAFTVATAANCAGDTMTVTVDGTSTGLVEGVAWNRTNGNNNATCTALEAAVDAVTGIDSTLTTCSAAKLFVALASTSKSLSITSSDATCASVSNSADGNVVAWGTIQSALGGTAAAPGISGVDSDTGIVLGSNNIVGIATGGVQQATFGTGVLSINAGYGVTLGGAFVTTPTSLTIADNGNGSTAATSTLTTPATAHYRYTCNDAQGCNLTLGETSVANGTKLAIVNISTNILRIADSAGVSETQGGMTRLLHQYDSVSFIYDSDRWVETGHSESSGMMAELGGTPSLAYTRTVAVSGTYYELQPTTTLTTGSGDCWTQSADGRLQWTCPDTVYAHCAASVSYKANAGSNQQVKFRCGDTGTTKDVSQVTDTVGSSDYDSTALHCMIQFSQNDYLSLWATNASSTNSIDIDTLNLVCLMHM